MATLGFESIEIGIHDGDTEIVKKTIMINSKKGGAIEAKIDGLNSEETTLHASNVAFFVEKVGTGTAKLDITTADLSDEELAEITGATFENGVLKAGKNLKPPYVSVILKSAGIRNDDIYIALLKGKLGFPDGSQLKTSEDKGREPDTSDGVLTGSFINRKLDDFTYFKTRSSNKDFELKSFAASVFNGYVPTP